MQSIARRISTHGLCSLLANMYLHELSGRKRTDRSFAGEASKVSNLLNDLKISHGYAADIAAGDGLTQSCTYHLYKGGWSGLCVEMDSLKFSKLAFLYRNFSSVSLQKVRVTPNNVSSILASAECPLEFDFLNLDIDSYDIHVLKRILESDFRPKLISMEINEKIPSNIFFSVDFDDKHYWKGDHFYGCSLGAASKVLSEFEYDLIDLEWNNAFFAPTSLTKSCNKRSLSPTEAYNRSYRNNPLRLNVFPWNRNVDEWQELTDGEAVLAIRKFFSAHEGQFSCYEMK